MLNELAPLISSRKGRSPRARALRPHVVFRGAFSLRETLQKERELDERLAEKNACDWGVCAKWETVNAGARLVLRTQWDRLGWVAEGRVKKWPLFVKKRRKTNMSASSGSCVAMDSLTTVFLRQCAGCRDTILCPNSKGERPTAIVHFQLAKGR